GQRPPIAKHQRTCMTYFQILKAARAANASDDQLELIEQLRGTMSQPIKTYYGTARDARDSFVKARLEKWLTALEVGHQPDVYWQSVMKQVSKSRLLDAAAQPQERI
ncbi:MAG TPA: hypothetical protein VE954_36370, partial [Oligoflexus sp.]|uniref:hypothetical protein n=1 Tax=Oligoflexus sp. TaxID=1971216 RepID=UPI002D39D2AE